MAVIRPTNRGEPLTTLRDSFVDRLVRELMGESLRNGPVIFEMPTGHGSEVDVIVVWDEWRPFSSLDRTQIIRRAYDRFSDDLSSAIHQIDPAKAPSGQIGPRVAKIAIGVTVDEALTQRLLPFSVTPMIRREDKVDEGDLRQLMIEVGAIRNGSGLQLRFPTAELASDVHARLMEEMPQGHWGIEEEAGPIND